jgi:ornithine carbamoyltransferase
MPINLRSRSILTLEELNPAEIRFLLRLAAELKAAKAAGIETPRLKGKNIALIFEKDSTRTRTGFEVAAYDQGAHVTYLGPTGSQIGHKESMKDTARVLGRIYDAIEYRGFSQQSALDLARFSGVPVYNGLTDEAHPTQALADFMTMREFTHKHLSDMTVVFMGDVRNNVARSLALGAMKLGMDLRLCGPRDLWPAQEFAARLLDVASATNAKLRVCDSPGEALPAADFVYTDVWLSMGEPKDQWAERIRLLEPYRVTSDSLGMTGNPYVKFMHCLPAFHNTETTIGAEIMRAFGIDCMEVTDDVFEGPASIVFDQAENRMHTIKALLVATLGA